MSTATWLAILWLAAVGSCDLVWRRLPNPLTMGAWGAAVILWYVSGKGLDGTVWPHCLLAGGAALGLGLIPYGLRLLGGGDVKLLVAIGLLMGPVALTVSFVVGSLLAGLSAVLVIMYRRAHPLVAVWQPWIDRFSFERGARDPATRTARPLPYGAALAFGAAVALVGRTL